MAWRKVKNTLKWVVKFRKNPLSEEQLKITFMAHDKNGDGHLDKEELKEAFRALGARIPCYRAGRAIYYSDIDLDGAINEDEIDHLISYAVHYGYSFN